jgi:predicted membrane-bound spermidine synthase
LERSEQHRTGDATAASIPPGRARRLLTAFFFVSGASSLIYQIVWQRLLGLHYGVSATASAIIVSVFMLGLGLGSLVAGHPVIARRRAIRAYMMIEIAIGAFGLLSLPLLASLARISAGASYGLVALWSMLFLLLPTLLMGATLPVALRALSRSATQPLRNIAIYYFANTLGAGLGAILASFLLVSLLGLDGAIYAAAGLNLLLAAALYGLARRGTDSEPGVPPAPSGETFRAAFLYPAVFLGGFIAIGYEMVWFRLLGILLKDSIYSFAILLGTYLVAVALGGYAAKALAARWNDQRDLYLVLNGGIALAVGATIGLLYHLGEAVMPKVLADLRTLMIVPIPPTDLSELSRFALSLAAAAGLAAWLVAIPAFLMGASFPLVASLAPAERHDPARTVSRIYFTLILGNVAGGPVTGFVLLPWLGSELTIVMFMLGGLGFLLLRARTVRRAVPLALGLLLIPLLPARGELVRFLHDVWPHGTVHVLEGTEGAVVVQRTGEKLRLFINGSEHGGRPGPSFYLEGMAALSFVEQPKEVLVIGIGTASLLEAALRDPAVGSVTLVEINATVLRALRRDPELAAILANPKLRIVIDDARRWLLRSDRRFDAILMDPLRSATAFSNNIYSEEFFRLQRAHLKRGGVAMIWTDELVAIPNTVARVYPMVRLYCDVFLVAGDPMPEFAPRPARLRAQLGAFPVDQQRAIANEPCARSTGTRSITFRSDTPLNRDAKPRTEYYLGPAVEQLLGLKGARPPWRAASGTGNFADMMRVGQPHPTDQLKEGGRK